MAFEYDNYDSKVIIAKNKKHKRYFYARDLCNLSIQIYAIT